MYYHFCLFHYRFLLVEKLIIPPPPPPLTPMSSIFIMEVRDIYPKVLLRDVRCEMWGFPTRCEVDSRERACGNLWFHCYFLLAFTGFVRQCGCFIAGVLRTFGASLELRTVGLLLSDYFCDITCHYCFFFVYYFNDVHVFCVMRNSPSCGIFYCIIILKTICLIL